MASVHEQVMAALFTRLQDISEANGYRHDVLEFHRGDVQPSQTPAIALRRGDWALDEDNHGDGNARASGTLAVSAEYVIAYDPDTDMDTLIHEGLADMEEAIFASGDDTLTKIADRMELQREAVEYRQEGGPLVIGTIDLAVRTSRLIGKPDMVL